MKNKYLKYRINLFVNLNSSFITVNKEDYKISDVTQKTKCRISTTLKSNNLGAVISLRRNKVLAR